MAFKGIHALIILTFLSPVPTHPLTSRLVYPTVQLGSPLGTLVGTLNVYLKPNVSHPLSSRSPPPSAVAPPFAKLLTHPCSPPSLTPRDNSQQVLRAWPSQYISNPAPFYIPSALNQGPSHFSPVLLQHPPSWSSGSSPCPSPYSVFTRRPKWVFEKIHQLTSLICRRPSQRSPSTIQKSHGSFQGHTQCGPNYLVSHISWHSPCSPCSWVFLTPTPFHLPALNLLFGPSFIQTFIWLTSYSRSLL